MVSSNPVVAVVGPTGFIGAIITPDFVKAAKEDGIAELRLLTTDTNKPKVREYLSNGAGKVKAFDVDYDQAATLETALQGVDVLVSAMGAQGDYTKRKNVLIEAAVKSGVKVYFPSEWGTNHTKTERYHPMFAEKQHHHHDAESRGLKVVAIYVALVTETSFCKWFGIDSASNTWLIPGDGNQAIAMTSQTDMGKYAVRAVLLSHLEPDKVSSHLEVYSDNRSWNSYADAMEKVAGQPIQRQYLSLEEAVKNYDAVKDKLEPHMLGPFIPVLAAEDVFDHSSTGNELLNPGHKFFVPKTVDDYAQEVGGKPWLNSSPWG